MILKEKREIGNRIAQKRLEKEYTQEKFADGLNMTRTAIGKIERGETIPNTDTLLAISNLLDVSTDWILKGCEAAKDHESSDSFGLLMVKLNRLPKEKQAFLLSTMNTMCDNLFNL